MSDYITIDEKYPELWEMLIQLDWWDELDDVIKYDDSAVTFHDYVSQNEHLHEEWILKIKLKLL